MSTIAASEGLNFGSVKTIKYALKADIEGIIDFQNIIDGALTLAQSVIDNNFFEISPILETAEHQETEELNAHGITYSQRIGCRFAGDRADIRSQKRKVANRHLILYIEDFHANKKLVGTTQEPLMQTDDRRSGMKLADTNGSNFIFTGSTTNPAIILTLTA